MYRNKSSVSLRTLAYSLKQSINLDRNKAHSREFVPLRSSTSTVNLANYKNQNKRNNLDQEYLILLDTRKSRFGDKSQGNKKRQSNITDLSYNVKSTKQLFQKKERLINMARAESNILSQQVRQSEVPTLTYKSDEVGLTIKMLQNQYNKIKQEQLKTFLPQSYKTHNKLLQQSDALANELKEIIQKQNQFIQHQRQLQNRICFINEQIGSIEMNFREDLAERQYCEQFLHQYENSQQNHLKQQAQHVMKLILLQQQNIAIQKEKSLLQKSLTQLEKDFKEWRIQQNLELKQRRFQNKFKQHRIQLMKIQQDLDHITQQIITTYSLSHSSQNPLRKVRQYICSYFKKYNQININHISHAQIADGIDVFLCKEGLIQDFTKFLKSNTDKASLSNGTYSLKLTQYCDCLKKIQNLFLAQKKQINTLLNLKFQQNIITLKQQIQNLTLQIEKNLSQIKTLQQNIQIVLAQQSLSMIQLLNKGQNKQSLYNKNQGFFNLQQIKSKVKSMKLDQVKRINRVKEIYQRMKILQQKQIKYSELNQKKTESLNAQKQSLKKQIDQWKNKILQIKSIKKGYETKKQKCNQLIDQAISKMKEKDEAQKTLKAIQCEIQKLKKQKIQSITKKHQENKSLDLFRDFQPNILKNNSFSRMNFFNQTKKTFPKNILSDRIQNKLKLENLRCSSKDYQSLEEQASAQFNFVKNEQQILKFEKQSNKTQSSPKSIKERISIGALNDILFSKCNMVQSKNINSNPQKESKKNCSIFGALNQKDLNKLTKRQSSVKATERSQRSLKKSNKQNISRKTSVSKNMQKSSTKYGQRKGTPMKLSLEPNQKKQILKLQRSHSNNLSASKNKISQVKPFKKDINSIIKNKLLRR